MLLQCRVGSHLSPGVWDPGEWDVWVEPSSFWASLPGKQKGLGRWELEACCDVGEVKGWALGEEAVARQPEMWKTADPTGKLCQRLGSV